MHEPQFLFLQRKRNNRGVTHKSVYSIFSLGSLGRISQTKDTREQGDQIGRFFARWVIVLSSFWEIAKVAHILGLLFPTVMVKH
jgi:hypothetical protein